MISDKVRNSILSLTCLAVLVSNGFLWKEVVGLQAPQAAGDSLGKVIAAEKANRDAKPCFSKRAAEDWCSTSFLRLASQPTAADGKRVQIFGFLAIDSGVVTLFQNEQGYLAGDRLNSIAVLGGRDELAGLFEKFGYRFIQLEGAFNSDSPDIRNSGWIGELKPPLKANYIELRTLKEGVSDIKVRLDYL